MRRQKVTLEIEFDTDKAEIPCDQDWRKIVERPARHWEIVGVSYSMVRMTLEATTAYLDTLTTTQAMFWFLDNVDDEDPNRAEIYFYLRNRYRKEGQS